MIFASPPCFSRTCASKYDDLTLFEAKSYPQSQRAASGGLNKPHFGHCSLIKTVAERITSG
jgi:hypothetical protein